LSGEGGTPFPRGKGFVNKPAVMQVRLLHGQGEV